VRKGARTATFNGIIDGNGDMFCGIADMEVLEYIPREHLDKFKFWDSEVVLIDSNIERDTLDYVLSKT
jgi:hypothetical protein